MTAWLNKWLNEGRWGRKYCPSCKKDVIVKHGVAGKLWCKKCNQEVEVEE